MAGKATDILCIDEAESRGGAPSIAVILLVTVHYYLENILLDYYFITLTALIEYLIASIC